MRGRPRHESTVPQDITVQSFRSPRFWLSVLFLLHFLLTLYFFPPGELLGNPPLRQVDYPVHFYDAHAVVQTLNAGHSWGYDPYFMAGYPVGTVFDTSNKLVEVLVFVLQPLGEPLAFNLVVALLFLALPFVVYAAARLAGLGARSGTCAVALALAAWYIEPTMATMRHAGMFSFAAAAYLALLAISSLSKYLRVPTTRAWLLLTLSASLMLWLHALAFFILLIPFGALYLFQWRALKRAQHLALVGATFVALLVNLYWLIPFVQFRWIMTDTGYYLQGGLDELWRDLLQIGQAEGNSPYPRALFVRWFLLAFASVGLYRWWTTGRRDLAVAFGAGIGGLLALAYLGAYLPATAQLQPYRFISPAIFLAVLPAAAMLADTALWAMLRAGPAIPRLVAGALTLTALPGLLNTVYSVHPGIERSWTRAPFEDRLTGPTQKQQALFEWIRTNTTPEARILIQDWMTASLIPYFTGRQVIGGPYHPYYILNAYANAGWDTAFDEKISDFDVPDLFEYLQTFNVQWIIVNPGFFPGKMYHFGEYVSQKKPDFITPVSGVRDFKIYRVNISPTFFMQGSGRVQATYNTVRVQDASPGEVVLKYHWLSSLKTDPPLQLEPFPVLSDPVGFIRVRNGDVRDFVIYNGY